MSLMGQLIMFESQHNLKRLGFNLIRWFVLGLITIEVFLFAFSSLALLLNPLFILPNLKRFS